MDGTTAELLQSFAGKESARRRHGTRTPHSGTGGGGKWCERTEARRRDGGERRTTAALSPRRRTGREEEEEAAALFYARVTRTDTATFAHSCGKFGTQGEARDLWRIRSNLNIPQVPDDGERAESAAGADGEEAEGGEEPPRIRLPPRQKPPLWRRN